MVYSRKLQVRVRVRGNRDGGVLHTPAGCSTTTLVRLPVLPLSFITHQQVDKGGFDALQLAPGEGEWLEIATVSPNLPHSNNNTVSEQSKRSTLGRRW